MTTDVNMEKGLEAAKVAMAKFNEVALPWIKTRFEEAKPVALKAYEKSRVLLADTFKSLQQRMS